MKVEPLSRAAQASLGATHAARVTHESLSEETAATAQVFPLLVPAGTLVSLVGTALRVPFSDASDAAFNDIKVSAGDAQDSDRYLTATQVNGNGQAVLYSAGTSARLATTIDTSVTVTVTPMAGKALANVDAGELVLYFSLGDLAAGATG